MKSSFKELTLWCLERYAGGLPAIVLLFMVACATDARADAATNKTQHPELEFSWFRCEEPAVRVFWASLSSGGMLGYVGGRIAKVTEQRTDFLPRAGFLEVEKAAKRFVIERKNRASDTQGPGDLEPLSSRYCLSVRLQRSGKAAVANLESRSAASFNALLAKRTPLHRYVCPPREGELLNATGGCDIPVLTFVYDDISPCYRRHVVTLYLSGDAQHRLENKSQSDRYAMLSPAQLAALVRTAHSYDVTGDLSFEESPPNYMYQRGTEAQLLQLRAEVTAVTGFKWEPDENEMRVCTPVTMSTSQAQRWAIVDEGLAQPILRGGPDTHETKQLRSPRCT